MPESCQPPESVGCRSASQPFLPWTERQLIDVGLQEIELAIEVSRRVIPLLVDEKQEAAVVVPLEVHGSLPRK